MNEILKAMRERRSVRKFKSDMPTREQIDQVVESGLYAASGRGEQASISIVITNKELRDKFADVNRQIGGWDEGFDPFYGAPVIIAVLDRVSWPTHGYDGSLVIGNMLLAAHALGLGACWIHRAKQEFEMDEFKTILQKLGVDEEYEGIGHVALGYPDAPIPAPPARKEGRVFYID